MKILLRSSILSGALALALLLDFGAGAQPTGAGTPAGISSAMTQLFGEVKSFTAKADLQVLDASQAEIVAMPMSFALLDQKIRIESDATQVKNQKMPAGMVAALNRWGLARVVSIIRPDKELVYVVYPDRKALLRFPLKDGGKTTAPRITRTALDRETIDGHPCIKNKVVITDSQGQSVEATTWEATDLHAFPIQIQTRERETTSCLRFRDVRLAKPEATQFEPPEGCREYNSQEELARAIQEKTEGGKDAK